METYGGKAAVMLMVVLGFLGIFTPVFSHGFFSLTDAIYSVLSGSILIITAFLLIKQKPEEKKP